MSELQKPNIVYINGKLIDLNKNIKFETGNAEWDKLLNKVPTLEEQRKMDCELIKMQKLSNQMKMKANHKYDACIQKLLLDYIRNENRN